MWQYKNKMLQTFQSHSARIRQAVGLQILSATNSNPSSLDGRTQQGGLPRARDLTMGVIVGVCVGVCVCVCVCVCVSVCVCVCVCVCA